MAKVANFWGIGPEQAIVMPVYWVDVAVMTMEAEQAAEAQRRGHRERKAKRNGGHRR